MLRNRTLSSVCSAFTCFQCRRALLNQRRTLTTQPASTVDHALHSQQRPNKRSDETISQSDLRQSFEEEAASKPEFGDRELYVSPIRARLEKWQRENSTLLAETLQDRPPDLLSNEHFKKRPDIDRHETRDSRSDVQAEDEEGVDTIALFLKPGDVAEVTYVLNSVILPADSDPI